MLINGYVIVTKGDARVVRVEGRLVKNPSFWTTHVDVARTYEVIDGHNMPVVLQSHAELRMFGDSEFRMTIRYDTIEGQATTGIGPTGEPGPGES